jgi:hypothetical protein
MGIYNAVGLTMKVSKCIGEGRLDKAAFYFVARAVRDGRPAEGTAEFAELQQLKAAGYKFRQSPDGDILAEKPNGRFYSGREAIKAWNELTR